MNNKKIKTMQMSINLDGLLGCDFKCMSGIEKISFRLKQNYIFINNGKYINLETIMGKLYENPHDDKHLIYVNTILRKMHEKRKRRDSIKKLYYEIRNPKLCLSYCNNKEQPFDVIDSDVYKIKYLVNEKIKICDLFFNIVKEKNIDNYNFKRLLEKHRYTDIDLSIGKRNYKTIIGNYDISILKDKMIEKVNCIKTFLNEIEKDTPGFINTYSKNYSLNILEEEIKAVIKYDKQDENGIFHDIFIIKKNLHSYGIVKDDKNHIYIAKNFIFLNNKIDFFIYFQKSDFRIKSLLYKTIQTYKKLYITLGKMDKKHKYHSHNRF